MILLLTFLVIITISVLGYGIIFSYFVFATLLYGIEKFDILSSLMIWLTDNSYILENINYINNEFLKYFYNNQAN